MIVRCLDGCGIRWSVRISELRRAKELFANKAAYLRFICYYPELLERRE